MNTNHDALREALELGRDAAYEVAQRYHQEMAGYRKQEHEQKDADVAKIEAALTALSKPMPEAAAQKTPLDKLRHEMRLVTALTLKNPGVAITLPDLMATEGRKFMRGETSLFDQLPFGEMQSVTAMLSASPAAPERAKPEQCQECAIQPCATCPDAAAQPPHPQPQAQSATLRQCANPDSAGPEGVKPCNYPDCKCPTETPCLQGRVQPQAQPLLVRDLAEIIGKTVPEVSAVIVNLGLGNRSTNMELHPDEAIAVAKHFDQPQAQGEPEVVAHRYEFGNAATDGEPLITLQSHREAIAQLDLAWATEFAKHREAIAKRDAALVACVEALKLAMHWAGPAMERDMRSPSNSQWMVEKTQAQEDSIYAAITHANQVLEGGGK